MTLLEGSGYILLVLPTRYARVSEACRLTKGIVRVGGIGGGKGRGGGLEIVE